MSRVLWFGAWVAVACWSLVAFAGYGLLDAFGALAMRNADAFSSDPDTVVWIFQVFDWVRSLSTSIALVVWGVVSLAILAVPWLLDRLVGRSIVVGAGAPPYVGSFPQPRRRGDDGVIDLGPDQYSVRPSRPGESPPAARVAPRS